MVSRRPPQPFIHPQIPRFRTAIGARQRCNSESRARDVVNREAPSFPLRFLSRPSFPEAYGWGLEMVQTNMGWMVMMSNGSLVPVSMQPGPAVSRPTGPNRYPPLAPAPPPPTQPPSDPVPTRVSHPLIYRAPLTNGKSKDSTTTAVSHVPGGGQPLHPPAFLCSFTIPWFDLYDGDWRSLRAEECHGCERGPQSAEQQHAKPEQQSPPPSPQPQRGSPPSLALETEEGSFEPEGVVSNGAPPMMSGQYGVLRLPNGQYAVGFVNPQPYMNMPQQRYGRTSQLGLRDCSALTRMSEAMNGAQP